MNKTLNIILIVIFAIATLFFAVWAYRSGLSFGKIDKTIGLIGSIASIIGLILNILSYFINSKNISIKKNIIEKSSFNNIKGDISIGDNKTKDQR
ncbi:MAG: hypothetical protein ACOCP4_06040 [Candidatus Woesearchaeota archaeon]